MDILLVVCCEGIEQVTHIIPQTGNHFFQLVTTALQWLSPCFIRKNLINKHARLRHFRDETSKLFERIHVLISFHADISVMLLHSPRWSHHFNRVILTCSTAMEVRTNLVTVVDSLGSRHTALDHAAEEKNARSL